MRTALQVIFHGNYSFKFVTLFVVWAFFVSGVRGRQISQSAKIIQTKHGDNFHCFDIHDQPTLRHPLFKDHKVQMWPTLFNRKSMYDRDRQKIKLLQVGSVGEECPEGTVRLQSVPNNRTAVTSSRLISASIDGASASLQPYEKFLAIRKSNSNPAGVYYGASAQMYVWHVTAGTNQMNINGVWAMKNDVATEDVSMIYAGWGAYPDIFGDSETRLMTYWTFDGHQTVCYNYLCPGFVQVSKTISLGHVISPLSELGGEQYGIDIYIYNDPATGNWWLAFGNVDNAIGYWIKDAFPRAGGFSHATELWYGGLAACHPTWVALPWAMALTHMTT